MDFLLGIVSKYYYLWPCILEPWNFRQGLMENVKHDAKWVVQMDAPT